MVGEGAYPPGVTGKMIDALEGVRQCPVRRMCRAAEKCDGFDYECPDFAKITDFLNEEIPFADNDEDFTEEDFESEE